MLIRILLGGVLGGAMMFMAGAAEHMGLQWVDRTFKHVKDDRAIQELVKSQELAEGMYAFPDMPDDWPKGTAEASEKAFNEYAERFKQGPNGWLIVGPNGQNPMDSRTLGMEFAANVGACLLAALLLAFAGPPPMFARRWLALIVVGPLTWLAALVSHSIWYRFPWDFTTDELLCSSLDWLVAGFVIALVVRPLRVPVGDKT